MSDENAVGGRRRCRCLTVAVLVVSALVVCPAAHAAPLARGDTPAAAARAPVTVAGNRTEMKVPAARAAQLGAIGGLVLGAVLDSALARVKEAIAQAGTTAAATAVIAGATLESTIDNARVAFFKDLDRRIRDLNRAAQQRIEQIQSLVDKFAADINKNVEDITTSAQQITNSLPLSNKQPQVRDYTPDFVTSSAPGSIRLRVRGNFLYAAQKKYRPTLILGTLRLGPAENTTQSLSFDVPPAALPAGSPSAIQTASIAVVVPYPVRRLLFFKRTRKATFHLELGIVPDSPGTITFTPTVNVPAEHVHTLNSAKIKVDSDAIERDDEAPVGPVFAEPGCHLLTDTAHFVPTWSRGREGVSWTWRWVIVTQSVASAQIRAINHSPFDIYADGGIEGYVTANEACGYDIPTEQSPRPILLKWGGREVVPTAGLAGWKLLFSAFDNRTITVANQSYSERFLRVTCCTYLGDLTIEAPQLQDVKW